MKETVERIDWQAVRRRLAEGEQALARALDPDRGRLEEVFRSRAARLAAPAGSAPAATASPMLVFRAAGERFAVALRELAGVFPETSVTPVPGSAPELVGLANLHGEIRPVFDLRLLLGRASDRASIKGYLLVIRSARGGIGLRAEGIEGIRTPASGDVRQIGEADGVAASKFSKGLTTDNVNVVDVAAVLAHPAVAGERDTYGN